MWSSWKQQEIPRARELARNPACDARKHAVEAPEQTDLPRSTTSRNPNGADWCVTMQTIHSYESQKTLAGGLRIESTAS